MAKQSHLGKGLGALFANTAKREPQQQTDEQGQETGATNVPSSVPSGAAPRNPVPGKGLLGSSFRGVNIAKNHRERNQESLAQTQQALRGNAAEARPRNVSNTTANTEHRDAEIRRIGTLHKPSDFFFGGSDDTNNANENSAITNNRMNSLLDMQSGNDLHMPVLHRDPVDRQSQDPTSHREQNHANAVHGVLADSENTIGQNPVVQIQELSSTSHNDTDNDSSINNVAQNTDSTKPTEDNVSRQTSENSSLTDNILTSNSFDNDELTSIQGGYLDELDVAEITPNLHQPRTVFKSEELSELSKSITEVGLLQPIVVRKISLQGEEYAHYDEPLDPKIKYELIMGERRLRATKLAGLTKIPAIVKTTSDDHMLRDALLENLHRVALNPLEEAAAYQQMMQEFGLTQLELAVSVSKSRPQITNTLRLLQLPPVVQKYLATGKLSAGHARALLGLKGDKKAMEKLAKRVIDQGLSVRATEELVMRTAHPETRSTSSSKVWRNSPVVAQLEQRFSTKVRISGSKDNGRIQIAFTTAEEFERIMNLLDVTASQQDAENA